VVASIAYSRWDSLARRASACPTSSKQGLFSLSLEPIEEWDFLQHSRNLTQINIFTHVVASGRFSFALSKDSGVPPLRHETGYFVIVFVQLPLFQFGPNPSKIMGNDSYPNTLPSAVTAVWSQNACLIIFLIKRFAHHIAKGRTP